jgi:hypothetical protein
MPSLSSPDAVHTLEALSAYSMAFRNEGTIWRSIAPLVTVTRRSDKYYVFEIGAEFNGTDDRIAPLADAREITMRFGDDNYSVEDYALGMWLAREAVDNADDPLRPMLRALANIRTQLENQHEKRVADKLFNAANVPVGHKVTLSGSSQWSNDASDPLGALQDLIDNMIVRPNTLLLGPDTWRIVRRHPAVAAAIFPSGGNAAVGGVSVAAQAFADYLELDSVIVGRRRLNTANVNQTASLSRIWGKNALLAYVNPSPAIDDMSLVYTYSESQSNPVEDFDTKKGVKGAYYLKDGWNCDIKVVSWECGHLIDQAVA